MRFGAILLFVATAVGGGMLFQLALRTVAPRASGSFEFRDVEWKKSEVGDPASFHNVAYYGSGQLVGTGQYASGRYMVFVGVIRTRRLVPSKKVDTVMGWLPIADGATSSTYGMWDYGDACPPDAIYPKNCPRSLQEPEMHFQVLGWLALASDTVAQADERTHGP